MDTATKPITAAASLSLLLHAAAAAGMLLVYDRITREDQGVGHGVEVQLISSVLVSDQKEAETARKQPVAPKSSSESLMHAAEKRFAEDILTSLDDTQAVKRKDVDEKASVKSGQGDQLANASEQQLSLQQSDGHAYAVQSTSASQQQHTILELLHRRISDNKEYPYLARRQRREGVARVAFVLHPDGTVENAHLVTSSRAASLDRAALSAVKQIEPFNIANEYLDKSETFQVDIEFDLL